jgi:hypothetical protein
VVARDDLPGRAHSRPGTPAGRAPDAADDDRPWPDELSTGVFGQRARVAITKVRPELVLEVAADPALRGRRYRHALRYLRLRTDTDPSDVDAPA